MIITEKDIDGLAARTMRAKAGLTQAAFWKPLGVKQSVGCRYENDIPIPQAVRILLVAHYIGGLKIDAASAEGIAELERLGQMQSKPAQAKAMARGACSDIAKATKSLQAAHDALASL